MKLGQIHTLLNTQRGFINMLDLSLVNYFYKLGYKERKIKPTKEIERTLQGILILYGRVCYAAYWQGLDDYDNAKFGWGATDRFNYVIKLKGLK